MQTDEKQLIAQIQARDEHALEVMYDAYGDLCRRTAYNILNNERDAEEAFNDALYNAWNAIPANPPAHLQAYLLTLTRHIAINRYRTETRQKRGGGQVPVALEEHNECLASGENVEAQISRNAMLAEMNRFLGSVSSSKRRIFLARYGALMSVREIAVEFGMSEDAVKKALSRMRQALRKHLEQEGTDLLDVIGEVNAAYYEDMAQHFSGKCQRIRSIVMRFGTAAAVIGVMTVTAVTFASVFREGIQTTQQPASSGIQTASSDTQATDRSEASKPEQTLPTDLYEVVQNTTVTETSASAETTTELIIPFPADTEMPDNSLEQDVGSRFLVNQFCRSGILAMTVNEAHLYDSLADAGLTFYDLTESFRTDNEALRDFYEGRTNTVSTETANSALILMMNPDGGEENQQNWRFIKATITVENINAVSGLGGANGLTFSDGTHVTYSDFDFPINSFGFGVLPNREVIESQGKSFYGATLTMWGMQYNTSEKQFYTDSYRLSMIHLEPGEAITFEVGAFVPKIYTQFIDSHLNSIGCEIGTDLKQYYMFGTELSRPYVHFNFDE